MSAPKLDVSRYVADPLSPEEVIARCRWRSEAIDAYEEALREHMTNDTLRRLNAALIRKWGEKALSRIKANAWRRLAGGRK